MRGTKNNLNNRQKGRKKQPKNLGDHRIVLNNKNECETQSPYNYSNMNNAAQPWRVPFGTQIKYFDTNLSMTVVGNWTIVDITGMTQGPGVIQRIGNLVQLHEITLNFLIDAQNTDVFTAVRFAVVQWVPESDLVSITGGSVYETNNDVTSFANWDKTRNYRILKDVRIAMSGTSGGPTIAGYQTFSFDVPIRKAARTLTFNGATDACNKVYFMALGNSALAPFPNLTGRARLLFSDS